MSDRAPLLLRPIHRWFFLWEDAAASVYRVLAVASGAALTTAIAALAVSVPWYVLAVVALAVWIGLAIVQEHDHRVVLPVHAQFLAGLEQHVRPVLEPGGFDHLSATGPCRARPSRTESYVFQSEASADAIYIYRDPLEGVINVVGLGVAAITANAENDAMAVAELLQTRNR